ncbi:MAG: hypothetical protein P4L57_11505 [Rhizomicrobium sp.]|nr:hypothetical protein [Rhizomicrobium sp.]
MNDFEFWAVMALFAVCMIAVFFFRFARQISYSPILAILQLCIGIGAVITILSVSYRFVTTGH